MVLAVSKFIGYPTTPSELVSASFRGSMELEDDATFRTMELFVGDDLGMNDGVFTGGWYWIELFPRVRDAFALWLRKIEMQRRDRATEMGRCAALIVLRLRQRF